ncbi:MAG: hypothetical protein HY609_02030 [Deltaproteobacteria bacterium]|nr:hypothetical protein [Deltaproteobacteria bacterium]
MDNNTDRNPIVLGCGFNPMLRFATILNLVLLLLVSLSCAKRGTSSFPWDVVGIREGTCEKHDIVTFRNGNTIENLGFYLKYMDKFGDEKSPILIFRGSPCGMPCGDCGRADEAYFYFTKTGDTKKIVYPGLITWPTGIGDPEPVHDSRVFYGKCLASDREGVFIFERHAEETGQPLPPKWTSVTIITFNPDNSLKKRSSKRTSRPFLLWKTRKKQGLAVKFHLKNRVRHNISSSVVDMVKMSG